MQINKILATASMGKRRVKKYSYSFTWLKLIIDPKIWCAAKVSRTRFRVKLDLTEKCWRPPNVKFCQIESKNHFCFEKEIVPWILMMQEIYFQLRLLLEVSTKEIIDGAFWRKIFLSLTVRSSKLILPQAARHSLFKIKKYCCTSPTDLLKNT